jgi:hypothetical protein
VRHHFSEFKIWIQIPRVKGERVQWVRTLGLEGLLAKHLPLGTFEDQLSGIKKISKEELNIALNSFMVEVPAAVSAGVKALQFQVSAGSAVQEYINSKFALDGAFVGKFATLDDFHNGPEELIGTPNPKILQGMKAEHCFRGNRDKKFTTSNYNVTTMPESEWEFVVEPKIGYQYPHTPKERSQWPTDCGWRGECGREIESLDQIMTRPEVTRAGLSKEEVIGGRLYTGPMFVLYNAVLRGFPEKDVACLKDDEGKENRYETTIFAIASGITKLSKVTAIPPNRRLYRGLGGMILPRQFWELYPECQVTFTVKAEKSSAVDVLNQLKGTSLALSPKQPAQEGTGNCGQSAEAGVDLQQLTADREVKDKANVYDVSTEYLPLELPEKIREARLELPKGVRVVKEARREGNMVRMSVAVPIGKNEFKERHEKEFLEAVRAFCGCGHEVRVEAVADKPKDFRGGGALSGGSIRYP